jgi:LmbE family N-acetylglucosaminyl deacetylase
MSDQPNPAAPSALRPLIENWQRGLCIVAHPDDMEFGAAAAVARWTGQGKDLRYVMVTSGEAGIDGIEPVRCKEIREAEQQASARVVGVDQVDFLSQPDGVLEYGIALREIICASIRRHRPEIVITGNFRQTFGPGVLNQADHIATGQAVLDAIRDAGNRWIFHDQLADGMQPWNGVRQLWASGSPEAGHAVDITETFDAGVASLSEHRAYLDGLSFDIDPEEMLEGFGRTAGSRLGTRYAAAFEVYPLSNEELDS